MKLRMSPNIAIRHKDYDAAVNFYTNVIGFENRSSDPTLADFDANPINLFVLEDDVFSGPVLELFVEIISLKMDARYYAGEAKGRIVIFRIHSVWSTISGKSSI